MYLGKGLYGLQLCIFSKSMLQFIYLGCIITIHLSVRHNNYFMQLIFFLYVSGFYCKWSSFHYQDWYIKIWSRSSNGHKIILFMEMTQKYSSTSDLMLWSPSIILFYFLTACGPVDISCLSHPDEFKIQHNRLKKGVVLLMEVTCKHSRNLLKFTG